MNIKMILTDLDGTLLTPDKRVSEYTASVLRRAREAGLALVIATARPLRTVRAFLSGIEPDALICHNGALAYIGAERVIWKPIPMDTARETLLKISAAFPGKLLSAEIDDALYANFDVTVLWKNLEAVLTDFSDLPGDGAEKLIIHSEEENERALVLDMLPVTLRGIPTVDGLIMVQHRAAAKWDAALLAASRLGIAPNEIAAFGDDHSDVDMLRECGAGVAVENAIPEVKNAAKYTAPPNWEDGVARWIEENLLVSGRS